MKLYTLVLIVLMGSQVSAGICNHFYRPLPHMEQVIGDVKRHLPAANEAYFHPISNMATRLKPEQVKTIENSISYLEYVNSLFDSDGVSFLKTQNDVWRLSTRVAKIRSYMLSGLNVRKLQGDPYIERLFARLEEFDRKYDQNRVMEKLDERGFSIDPKITERLKESLPADISEKLIELKNRSQYMKSKLSQYKTLLGIYTSGVGRYIQTLGPRYELSEQMANLTQQTIDLLQEIKSKPSFKSLDLDPLRDVVTDIVFSLEDTAFLDANSKNRNSWITMFLSFFLISSLNFNLKTMKKMLTNFGIH